MFSRIRHVRYGLLALLLALWLLPAAFAEGAHDDNDHHDDHHAGMSSGADIVEPADVHYTLRTSFGAEGIGYFGVGGDIDGILNPELSAPEGSIVAVTIINGDGLEHDITFPDFGAMADHIFAVGEESTVKFHADQAGTFEYYCGITGHREAGMLGQFTVKPATDAQDNSN